MTDRVLSFISLANKAGRVQSGEFAAEKAIKELKAFVVILAEDASYNTKKHFKDMCSYRDVPIYEYGTKEILGAALGKEFRTSVAITDKGFSDNIIKLLAEV